MHPPLTEVADAHAHLRAVIADLTDDQVTAPSRLPGWTRGHVLAHLADAARARADVVEQALRGNEIPMWAPGERDAIIEATATRTAAEHRHALDTTATRLDRLWSSVEDWSTGLAPAVFTRWREVWIHLVDLDLGVHPAHWSTDFAAHAVDLLHRRLPEGHAVHATDVDRTWGSGPTTTTGDVRGLAAWLAGRADGEPGSPELGPWPTY
ncbi:MULTISPECIES: maleylpyruvate isomerase family mycothiol-dependent enzyme [unclassified Saccharothrix]|uniref:maleylpyruvate isomerase family mycothiol-dependent enzyme n=1 Tax=unclassified Saccharothrix TaxID=2593673 RepID=UPI00307F1EEE